MRIFSTNTKVLLLAPLVMVMMVSALAETEQGLQLVENQVASADD